MRFNEIENLTEGGKGSGLQPGDRVTVRCAYCGAHGSTYDFDANIQCDAHPDCSRGAKYRVEFMDGKVENHATLRSVKTPQNPSFEVLRGILNGTTLTGKHYGIKSIARWKSNGEYEIAPNKIGLGSRPGTGYQTQMKCDHCGKTASPSNYAQWHGDKCRQNPNYNPIMKYRVEYIDGSTREFGTFSDITNDHLDHVFKLNTDMNYRIYRKPGWSGAEKYGIISIEKI